jgi:serine protease
MPKRRWTDAKRAGGRRLTRHRISRLLTEQLEDRRLLAVAPAFDDSIYGRVDPAWFSSLSAADRPAAVETITTAGGLGVAAIGPQTPARPVKAAPVDGEWIVRLSATALANIHGVADAAAYLRTAGTGIDVVRGLGLPGQLLVRAATPGIDLAAALRGMAGVSYVSANSVLRLSATPNDPSFGQLYGLDNRAQTGGTADADIDAPEAWEMATGSKSTVVGIVDTGIDWSHPDLAWNVWTNPGEIPGNGIDDDQNGFTDDVHGYDFVNGDGNPMDDQGHGTHVAGTIGAVGNNGTGVVGVNWDVSLMGLKFLDAWGSGTDAAAIQAINYATMMRSMYGVDIRVLNNSWGGVGFDQGLLDAINASGAAGILFVAAAGNDGVNTDTNRFYPSGYDADSIVSVAATDARDALASFSNYGKTTVDLAAPGVNILSTVPGGYATYSGTSMAAPHVAGVAALASSVNPSLGVADLRSLLLDNADPVAALAGKTVTGGRLNAERVVRAARQGISPPSITGRVFEDLGGNATRDAVDPLLRGITVYVDADGNGIQGPGEPAAMTTGGGSYAISGLAAGTYTVRSVAPAGWNAAAPRTVTVAAGGLTTADVDFGLSRRNALYGRVVEDFDGGGTADADEPPLANQRVYADVNGNGSYDTSPLAAASGTVNLSIEDFQTTTSSIVVAGQTQRIVDLNVAITINHTWVSDLLIALVAPDGTTITLSNHRGGAGDNFLGTVFDDQATRSIASGVAPFTGSYRPDGSLGIVNGMSPNGTWSLRVMDDDFFDVGTLVSWSLAFTTSAEQSTTSDANGFFTLPDVAPGTHSLRLAPTAGFVPSGPAGGVQVVTLAAGQTVFGTNLTAARTGSIAGRVFSDTDADGVLDVGEPGLAGVTVYVDANSNGLLDATETRTQTGAGGVYRFTGRNAGVHTIRAVVPAGLGLNAPAAGRWAVSLASGGVSFNNHFAFVANRTPTDVALSPAAIAENAAIGALVGTLRGIDPDIGDPQSFSLVDGDGSGDNASFTIVAGQLRAQAVFDFEKRSSYSVRVRTTDSAGQFFERPLTVAITNVNETPTAVVIAKATIAENAGVNAVVGGLGAIDTDVGDTFSFALVAGEGSTDNARFNVSGASLRASSSFDYETRTSYSVRLRATDRGGRFAETAFTITVTDVNDAPVIGGVSGPVTYVENGVVAPAPAATVLDVDSADFAGGTLTVRVAANANATDRLAIRNDGTDAGQVGVAGTVVSYGGVAVGTVAGGSSGSLPLVVTFNAAATPSVAQAVLRNVQYRSTSENPAPLTRTLSYAVNDGDGGTSAAATQVITITPVNDAPVLTMIPTAVSFRENAVLLPAGAGVVADPDSPNYGDAYLAVSITANADGFDRLTIRHQGTTAGLVGVAGGNVTFGGVVVGTFTGGSATAPLVVAFNTAATPAAVQAVVRNVAYTNTSENPLPPLTRSLAWELTDGDGGTSPTVTQTVTIVPVNDAPVIGGIASAGLAYAAGSNWLPIATDATVTDVDSPRFGGGTLSVALIAGGLASDRLAVQPQGTSPGQIGISGTAVTWGGTTSGSTIGSWSGGTGTSALVIALNAAATPEAVQALLRSIAYSSVAADPTNGGTATTRTIRFTLSDAATAAGGLSAMVTTTLAMSR